MRRSLLLIVPLLAVAASCYGVNPAGLHDGSLGNIGGGGGGSADFTFDDPAGDTLNPASSGLPRALDALRLSVDMDTDSITFQLTFGLPVTPWSEQGVGALDGYIDIDIDENSATGDVSSADQAGSDSGIGVDFYITLFDVLTNRAGLVDVAGSNVTAVPMTFDGNTVTIRIPRDKLGEEEDGNFRMNAVVGTIDRSVTDILPNTGFYTVRPL